MTVAFTQSQYDVLTRFHPRINLITNEQRKDARDGEDDIGMSRMRQGNDRR